MSALASGKNSKPPPSTANNRLLPPRIFLANRPPGSRVGDRHGSGRSCQEAVGRSFWVAVNSPQCDSREGVPSFVSRVGSNGHNVKHAVAREVPPVAGGNSLGSSPVVGGGKQGVEQALAPKFEIAHPSEK